MYIRETRMWDHTSQAVCLFDRCQWFGISGVSSCFFFASQYLTVLNAPASWATGLSYHALHLWNSERNQTDLSIFPVVAESWAMKKFSAEPLAPDCLPAERQHHSKDCALTLCVNPEPTSGCGWTWARAATVDAEHENLTFVGDWTVTVWKELVTACDLPRGTLQNNQKFCIHFFFIGLNLRFAGARVTC